MTGYQILVAKLRGQNEDKQPKSWKDAPAPAQVGKRILTGVFHEQVGVDQAGKLTTGMHWPTEPVGAPSTAFYKEQSMRPL